MSSRSSASRPVDGHLLPHPRSSRLVGVRCAGAAAALVLSITACGGTDVADETARQDATSVTTAGVGFGAVSPAESSALIGSGVRVIDVRTPEEYADGHLEGATLIDFYEADFADRIAELPTDQEYLVYCRSGNRSGQAVQIMQELGFDRVHDLEGGVVAYTAAGFPLTP